MKWSVLLLVFPLQGCFFLYVPGSLIDKVADGLSGAEGNMCVSESAYVGGRVRNDRLSGTVEKLEGKSRRCSDPTPIRAVVRLD